MSSGSYRFTSYTGERMFIRARAVVNGELAAQALTAICGVNVVWIPS